MTCEQCTYLPESEGDYLQTSFLDINQLSLLSGINTPAESCANELPMDGSPTCQCGKEMSDCSIHPNTPDTMDSLPPKSATALQREMEITRPGRSKPSNLRDQVSNMQNWPTPQARDYRSGDNPDGKRAQRKAEQGWSQNLNDVVMKFPTPAARDWKDNGTSPAEMNRNSTTLATIAGGSLNPKWVAWLMGFPIEWTNSRDWEMLKSLSKQQQRSKSSMKGLNDET